MFTLREELLFGVYHHGPYARFIIHDPKKRTIHKASVRDRLVHQAVVNVLEPIFERQFIFDGFSCRAGKGTHAGVARLRSFLRKVSQNNTRTVYALKFDIQRFFDEEHLRVGVHPAKVVLRTWPQGVDFLGYVLLPHCTVLRTKTSRRMLRRACASNLSSYLGLCVHADTYELRNVLLSGVREPE